MRDRRGRMPKGAEGRWREEMGMRRTCSTYGAKMRQANREAVATVIALAVIVAVWLVGGIGLAGCGILAALVEQLADVAVEFEGDLGDFFAVAA